jgi:predicted phosphodiesterase
MIGHSVGASYMRMYILSDLHLEFKPFIPQIPEDIDLVILVGDIDVGDRGVQWAQRHFESAPVVYIPGNHEYYHYHLGVLQRRLRIRARNTNVTILDNHSVVMGNYQIYGATLWTDWALDGSPAASAKYAQRNINDFTLIRTGGEAQPLTPEDVAGFNTESRTWLEKSLRSCEKIPIVVTHFAPSRKSIAPRFVGSPLNPAFLTDCEDLFSGVPLWIHGHTHAYLDYVCGDTRVICNPRGYPSEDTGFDPHLVISL